ncbi:MAG: carbamoyltransferase C-terminal domain-containing protein [Candidatus Omnitrophota bacterium]|nr:carbamoyltransferase C-terminal domain-containing protein [Candidatus Omnitrophota bacterium]
MRVLGFGGPGFLHDPAAAIVVDGKVVAAVEEERLIGEKHAVGKPCVRSIEFCIKQAGISAKDIDAVAFPWSTIAFNKKKWRYAARTLFSEPSRAYKTIVRAGSLCAGAKKSVFDMLAHFGIDLPSEKIFFVEHHIAHAASAHLLSGYERSAIMSIDGSGEFTSTLFAEGSNSNIRKIKEIDLPDSLGRFYSTMTAYLGFNPNDGEYKLMGMAPYGDSSKVDLSDIISCDGKTFKTNPEYVWPIRSRRYVKDAMIPKKLVERFGPPRKGDLLEEPYIHIAAATQKIFEDIVMRLMDEHLGGILRRTGSLTFAGGCALNVSLNRKLIENPLVRRLFVQPASHDAGTPLGAAVSVAAMLGDKIEPMRSVYLGPDYSNERIEAALKRPGIHYKLSASIEKEAAQLLAEGMVVGWFQGRMEFGPRALGNRSILGNPTIPGTSDRINGMVKFREKWRPFCPSILREHAKEIIGRDIDAPFMTLSFSVTKEWKSRIQEVVHVDGTMRPETVTQGDNPRFYKLIKLFFGYTGVPVLINTSLNRRGEPMVCSPEDAVEMYLGSGLDYLAIGDYLVSRK